MSRIVVCGCSGSGKTTFALRLGRRLGLPVVHLDVLFWRPGWTQPDRTGFRQRVSEAIDGERWICDGNYSVWIGDLTLPRADRIIMLERSRWLCLARVIRRSLFQDGRADLAEGCQEHFDWQLIRYIWNYPKLGGPRMEAACMVYGDDVPLLRLRGGRAIAAYLSSVDASADRI